jgi:hypothetical protein
VVEQVTILCYIVTMKCLIEELIKIQENLWMEWMNVLVLHKSYGAHTADKLDTITNTHILF